MKNFLLTILVAVAVFAYTYAETTCEAHRRNSQRSAHGLSWDIQCKEENGKYKPLQCTTEANESKRWCACYNEEEAITNPSKKTRTCVCPLAKDEATQNGNDPCQIPTCDSTNSGKFEAKQCCSANRKCHCVNPETGERTTEPTSDRNLQCPA